MKTRFTSGLASLLLLFLAISLPHLSGCAKGKEREDPRNNPDFVDTSDPSKLQMKPLEEPDKRKPTF